MNGVERNPARRKTGAYRSAVARDLPLVISNQAELEKSAEIFFQGEDLAKAPLHGEGLTRRQVRAGLLAVAFPVGEQVCAGSLVLGDVERSAGCQVVAPISRADVIARSWNESACRSDEGVPYIDVSAFQVPAQIDWLDPGIAETRTSATGAEVGSRQVGHERTACWVYGNIGGKIRAKEFALRYVEDDVLVYPERVSARDIWKMISVGVIQLVGGVVKSQVGIGEAGWGSHQH